MTATAKTDASFVDDFVNRVLDHFEMSVDASGWSEAENATYEHEIVDPSKCVRLDECINTAIGLLHHIAAQRRVQKDEFTMRRNARIDEENLAICLNEILQIRDLEPDIGPRSVHEALNQAWACTSQAVRGK